MERADDALDGLNASSDGQGSLVYLFIICAVAAVGGLLFGFDTAIIAGATEFIRVQFELTEFQEGLMAGSLLVGCMIGAGVAGFVSDRLGRKRVLIAAAAFYVVSAICAGLPRNVLELMAARFMGGLAVGISSMVAPLYIAEIAPARLRGRLVTLQQMAIVTGILMANLTGGLLADSGEHNWRWMFASAALPSLLLFIALLFVPESPRWLAKQNLFERARAILTRVGGRGHADSELADIRQVLSQEEGSLWELLRPGLRIPLLIGLTLAVLGQVSGINTVIYYAPKIFLAAGFVKTTDAVWATVPIGITNFVMTVVSLLVIDQLGRKALLMIGTGGMTISMVLAATLLNAESLPAMAKVGIILLYISSFGLGVGGVVWVVISEIFPTKVRGRGCAVATVGVWGACFLVTLTFPWLLATFADRVYYLYAVLSLAMFLFVAVVVPETKGKSLEEIERMWRRQGAEPVPAPAVAATEASPELPAKS